MRQMAVSQEQEPVSPSMHEKLASPPTVNSPTEEEKKEHLDNQHYPYESWCPVCVGSKARHRGHSRRRDKGTYLVPEVSWDFNTYFLEGLKLSMELIGRLVQQYASQFPRRLTIRGCQRRYMRSSNSLAELL